MTLKAALAMTLCIGMSACTTVDITQVASQTPAMKSTKIEKNVVQRSAAKLAAAFSNKGWTSKESKRRVQSAASVLLKGLEDKDTRTAKTNGYADQVTNASMVHADLREAAQLVSQTTKAAEVYLAMAPADASLLRELSSLEKALLTSRQAESVFARACDKIGAEKTMQSDFTASVDALRDVTNAYGDRVREVSAKALGAS